MVPSVNKLKNVRGTQWPRLIPPTRAACSARLSTRCRSSDDGIFLGVAQPFGRKDSRVPLSSGCEARTVERLLRSKTGTVRVNGTCERNVLVTAAVGDRKLSSFPRCNLKN